MRLGTAARQLHLFNVAPLRLRCAALRAPIVRPLSAMADSAAPEAEAPAAATYVDPATGETVSKNELKRRLKAAEKEKEKEAKAAAAAAKAAAEPARPAKAAAAAAAAEEEGAWRGECDTSAGRGSLATGLRQTRRSTTTRASRRSRRGRQRASRRTRTSSS